VQGLTVNVYVLVSTYRDTSAIQDLQLILQQLVSMSPTTSSLPLPLQPSSVAQQLIDIVNMYTQPAVSVPFLNVSDLTTVYNDASSALSQIATDTSEELHHHPYHNDA
jgi:hypothetical protein